MASPQISSKRNLAHYALDKSGFAFTVLSDKSHLLSALDGEFGMVENLMPSVGLPYVFKNQRIVAATGSRGNFSRSRELSTSSTSIGTILSSCFMRLCT